MIGGLADGISKKTCQSAVCCFSGRAGGCSGRCGQTGASFTFRYEIAPNSPDKPPLLNILERVNASSGSVSGQYAPGKLQLSFYQLNEDDSVKTSPFTRVYIDSEETLFDIGQLYTVLRQAVTDKLEDHAHSCAADHPGPQRPHPAHRHGDFCQDGALSPGFPDE